MKIFLRALTFIERCLGIGVVYLKTGTNCYKKWAVEGKIFYCRGEVILNTITLLQIIFCALQIEQKIKRFFLY